MNIDKARHKAESRKKSIASSIINSGTSSDDARHQNVPEDGSNAEPSAIKENEV